MLVNFISKEKIEDGSIELVTTIILNQQTYNIYKYTNNDTTNDTCDKIFITPFKYIGYFKNEQFYVVNLEDDVFDETFKREFNFFDTQQGKWRSLLPEIKNFKFITFPLPCIKPTINLYNARLIIDGLNKDLESLNLSSGCNYKLGLNYVYQMNANTEINMYEDDITPIMLLLCIFVNNVCVSSLTIEYSNNSITFNSKTKNDYENNKLNKLLRSVLIIISKHLYPEATRLESVAINPKSYWLMKKTFNAITINNKKPPIILDTYEDIDRYLKKNNYNTIHSYVELSEDNIKNAKSVFENIIRTNELRCVKQITGGKRKFKNKRRISIRRHR